MKKFYLFLFSIITFGLFLIPSTFAKSIDKSILNESNLISDITYDEVPQQLGGGYRISIDFDFDYNDLTFFNNSNINNCVLLGGLSIFDSTFTFKPVNINHFRLTDGYAPHILLKNNTSSALNMPLFDFNVGNIDNYENTYNNIFFNSLFFYKGDNDLSFSFDNGNYICDGYNFNTYNRGTILLYFDNVDVFNLYKTYYFTFSLNGIDELDFVNGSMGFEPSSLYEYAAYFLPRIPMATKFVPNNSYYAIFNNNGGLFYDSRVSLLMQRVSNEQDITNETIYYNSIQFSGDLAEEIAENNSRSTYQYYFKFYLNLRIKDFVNLNISRLRLNAISLNGVYYTYQQALSSFDGLFYNNIDFISDNATLFVSGFDALNSDYKDFVVDYIIFDFVNYEFTQSEYYNSSLGVLGYIENSYVSIFSYNALDLYNKGYEQGSSVGYKSGYDRGKSDGIASNKTGFDNLMFAIADVPMKIISSMLNFELLGFNLMYFFMGIITLLLFVKLMQKFKE